MEVECPFGPDVEELNPWDLTVAEKMWIGEEIRSERCSVIEMMQTYQLSRFIVNKYARLVRKSIPIHLKEGRPPVLDNESVALILLRLENASMLNTYCKADLKVFVFQENWETLSRSGREFDNSDQLSRRSLNRYINKFWDIYPSASKLTHSHLIHSVLSGASPKE
jgi:hypothetical protein